MLEILKSSPGDKLTYCLLVQRENKLDAECVKLKDIGRLVAIAKSQDKVCALEVHPDGRVESVCDTGMRIAQILSKLRP